MEALGVERLVEKIVGVRHRGRQVGRFRRGAGPAFGLKQAQKVVGLLHPLAQNVAAADLRRARKGGVSLRAAVSRNADAFAAGLAEVVAAIRAEGHVSLRAIAAELNARGILTRRGGRWQVSNVRNLIGRFGD